MSYYKALLSSIFANIIASTPFDWFMKGGLALLGLVAGIKMYFIAVIALSLIDCVTGIWASLKQGISFKSSILRKGLIEKVILYNVLLISCFIIELIVKSGVNYSHYYFVIVAAVCISTNELVSIFENVLKISPDLGFIKRLIGITKKVQDVTLDKAEDAVEKI